MKKIISVFYRYRPIRKLYLSACIGIGQYEKKLIGCSLMPTYMLISEFGSKNFWNNLRDHIGKNRRSWRNIILLPITNICKCIELSLNFFNELILDKFKFFMNILYIFQVTVFADHLPQ